MNSQKYAQIIDGTPVEIQSRNGFTANGFHFPAKALSTMSDEELAQYDVYPIVEPDPLPANAFVIDSSLDFEGGSVYRVHQIQYREDAEIYAEKRDILLADIDKLRDEKIDGGFDYVVEGATHRIQTRASDRENIGNLGLLATMIQQVSPPGNLRWLMPDKDFKFITADNQQIPMDAQQMAALYQFGLGFKDALTFHARSLKDQVKAAVAGEDYGTFDQIEATYTQNWPF